MIQTLGLELSRGLSGSVTNELYRSLNEDLIFFKLFFRPAAPITATPSAPECWFEEQFQYLLPYPGRICHLWLAWVTTGDTDQRNRTQRGAAAFPNQLGLFSLCLTDAATQAGTWPFNWSLQKESRGKSSWDRDGLVSCAKPRNPEVWDWKKERNARG